MDSVDFSVRIGAAEAASIVEDEIARTSLSARLVDKYEIAAQTGKCIVMVFDKYYMRTSSRASLTVVIDDIGGVTGVHAVGSGGGEGALFSFDWGAGQSFANVVNDALEKYR